MAQAPKSRALTIGMGTALGAVTVLTVLATAALIFFSWEYTSRRNVEAIVETLNKSIVRDLTREISGLIRQAEGTREIARDVVTDPGGEEALDRRLRSCLMLLAGNDHFFTVGFGAGDGSFYAALRGATPEEITLEKRIHDEAAGTTTTHSDLYRLDKDGLRYLRSTTATAKVNPYDARKRGWYRKAAANPGKGIWTSAYIFHKSKRPGVGTAVTLAPEGAGEGVALVDIELAQISEYLGSLDVGKSGVALLLNPAGEIVAFPDYGQVIVTDEEADKVHLRRLENATSPMLKLASETLRGLGLEPGAIDTFRRSQHVDPATGRKYYVTFAPLGALGWTVGTVVPESDFLGAIERNRRILFSTIPILLVVAILVAVLITRWVVGAPLLRLTDNINRLQALHFGGEGPVVSSIQEIQRISDSLASMESALKSFRKYVPADLVRQLVEEGDAAQLGGEKRDLTLFVSSVPGFRSLSESMTPEDLMPQLSEYLEAMTQAVIENGGTVDKYIGDMLVAFWNAPVAVENHEEKACRAAFECHQRLEALNRKWAAERRPALATTIGIHTGPAIVGNMGTSVRMSYSAMGDAVDLAIRLQESNGTYGARVLLSERTRSSAGDAFLFRPVDRITDRTHPEGVTVFELVGQDGQDFFADAAQRCSEFRMGFRAFTERDFRPALHKFQEMAQRWPEDKAIRLYIERCEALLGRSSGPNLDALVRMDDGFLAAIEQG